MDFVDFTSDYLRSLLERDPKTVNHFVDYFTRLIRLKVSSRGVSYQDGDDITQETLSRVFQQLQQDKLRTAASLGAFVNGVCNNVIREHRRKDRGHFPLEVTDSRWVSYEPDLEELILDAERRELVKSFIQKVGARDRRLLRLLFLEGKTREEACLILGLSGSNLRVRIHRMIKRIQKKMKV